jgi:hypothetical protein
VSSLGGRLWGCAYNVDRALNALGGGDPDESLSGTLGRALADGRKWARPLVAVVNAAAWLIARQKHHCQVTAADEARRRALLFPTT